MNRRMFATGLLALGLAVQGVGSPAQAANPQGTSLFTVLARVDRPEGTTQNDHRD